MTPEDVKSIADGVLAFVLLMVAAVLIGSVVGWLVVQAITRIVGSFDV